MIQSRPGSMINYDAADGGVLPEFDRASVAELTTKEISEMPREKLMQALARIIHSVPFVERLVGQRGSARKFPLPRV